MKKGLIFILSIFLILNLSACKSTKQTVKKENKIQSMREYETGTYVGPKKKLAISSFKNETRFGKRRLGENMSDIITTELSKTNRYILLERQDVDKIFEEVQLSSSGLTQGNLNNVKLLDADYIIMGAVTKYSFKTDGQKGLVSSKKVQTAEVMLDIKIIDLKTGEIVLAESGEGTAVKETGTTLGMGSASGYDETLESDAFRAAVIKVMENMIKTLEKREWSAKVVKVSNGSLYLNAGKKSNIGLGTLLQVFKQGEAIEDNGRFLGYEEEFAGTAKVSSYFGDNGAKAEMVEGKLESEPGIVKIKK